MSIAFLWCYGVRFSLDELAGAVGQHPCVLAIVHRRQAAEDLARALGPHCLHLSAPMCAEPRSAAAVFCIA